MASHLLGEWSPRDEKGVHNRPGRENLQSRTSDREQVVRLGLYGLLAIAAFVFCYELVPETKEAAV